MSFLDTMREILETVGLLKHDTQKVRPLSSTEPPAAPPSPCRLCGADSWWRAAQAEAWLCRTCHPPANLPVYEVLGPHGKPGDVVRSQARADTAAWLAAWREVAKLTDGMTKDCLGFETVMVTLEQCDTAFLANDWPGFQRAAVQVRLAVQTEHE